MNTQYEECRAALLDYLREHSRESIFNAFQPTGALAVYKPHKELILQIFHEFYLVPVVETFFEKKIK